MDTQCVFCSTYSFSQSEQYFRMHIVGLYELHCVRRKENKETIVEI